MINTKSLKPGSRAWLEQAVTISIFTDARATDSDVLPDSKSTDKRGSWDDIFLAEGQQRGSRLWLLERSSITPDTLNEAKEMLHECMEWLLDNYLKKADVVVIRLGKTVLQFELTLWVSATEKFKMEIPYAL